MGFTYHNATAQSGTVVLGDILATVPNSAASIYKTNELLALSGITVTGGAAVLDTARYLLLQIERRIG